MRAEVLDRAAGLVRCDGRTYQVSPPGAPDVTALVYRTGRAETFVGCVSERHGALSLWMVSWSEAAQRRNRAVLDAIARAWFGELAA